MSLPASVCLGLHLWVAPWLAIGAGAVAVAPMAHDREACDLVRLVALRERAVDLDGGRGEEQLDNLAAVGAHKGCEQAEARTGLGVRVKLRRVRRVARVRVRRVRVG